MDTSVYDKLRSLYELQDIDSRLDEFKILKGELPMEVHDLEDDVAGLETRIQKGNQGIEESEGDINRFVGMAKDAENNIKRYQKQMDEVKNNREYEALTKEIKICELDIKLSDKKIAEVKKQIELQKQALEITQAKYDAKKKDEEKHIQNSEKQRKKLEERLLKAYDRIRRNYRNGLAVVTVERNSCGGCFNYVPPQVQLEVGLHDKVVACEHCGRILVDDAVVNGEVPA